LLIFVVRASNPSDGADGRSHFRFKCPRLHLGQTAPSLTAVKRYTGDRLANKLHLFVLTQVFYYDPHCCLHTCTTRVHLYKVVQIWPGLIVYSLHTKSPGHIWTTLYFDHPQACQYKNLTKDMPVMPRDGLSTCWNVYHSC